MPSYLEISTIDVGQGDSSLIIAADGAGQVRSMLIDGGLAGYGATVHNYVVQRLNVFNATRLDHILVSHYDRDHVGGVLSLLLSDNFSAIVRCLATAAAAAWDAAATASDAQRTAAAGAAAAAAAWGAYNGRYNHADLAAKAGAEAARLTLSGKDGPDKNAAAGVDIGLTYAYDARGNDQLIRTPQSSKTAAVAAGVGVFMGRENDPARRQAFTERRIFDSIKGAVAGSFMTGGLYAGTQVIDAGASQGIPDKWADTIAGAVPMWKDAIPFAPGITRNRFSVSGAALGSEVLWRSGPGAQAAPAGSPAAFLVTGLGYVWGRQTGLPPINSGQPQNDVAVGLVVRFGNFFYFTAGDLPTQGEDLVAQRVLSTGFDNPQGGPAFAPASRFAAFKVSHHGSDGSSSDPFLAAIKATGAFISCGKNKFGEDGDRHPTQAVIDRLNARVARFYLTNCKYLTQYVPATNGIDQLSVVQNRSRICGDNADDNLAVFRRRGNARLFLTQDESTGNNVTQQFHVDYWDNDDLPGQPYRVVGLRVENLLF